MQFEENNVPISDVTSGLYFNQSFTKGDRMKSLFSLAIMALFATGMGFNAQAAGKSKSTPAKTNESVLNLNYEQMATPEITTVSNKDIETWMSVYKKDKRKLASSSTQFSESDLSEDFVKLRNQWLAAKNAQDVHNLLEYSYKNYSKYSPDVRYFLAQMHNLRPLRGIIWKLRPMFETGGRFSGNTATHVTAIQFVRQVSTGLKAGFPTEQTDAMIEFLTQPSDEMTEAEQFPSIGKFQNFLVQTYIPALNESLQKIKAVHDENPTVVYKWDNKMFYGTAAFKDGVKRVSGHGAAERHMAMGLTYEAIHDSMVFCAYNQDALLDVAAELGRKYGIDAGGFNFGSTPMGLTDRERIEVVRKYTDKKHFLEKRDYKGTKYGSQLMTQAGVAKKAAIENFYQAYQVLQTNKAANPSMVLNPALYQEDIQNRLSDGVDNMRRLVNGPEVIRDPITGKEVKLDVMKFYSESPANLKILMPIGFEKGNLEQKIKNKFGAELHVRNYMVDRSIAWDNEAWSAYVPSAKNKSPDYMLEAKRTMHYALGASLAFGVVDLFVR
jgi:hypothetical protein